MTQAPQKKPGWKLKWLVPTAIGGTITGSFLSQEAIANVLKEVATEIIAEKVGNALDRFVPWLLGHLTVVELALIAITSTFIYLFLKSRHTKRIVPIIVAVLFFLIVASGVAYRRNGPYSSTSPILGDPDSTTVVVEGPPQETAPMSPPPGIPQIPVLTQCLSDRSLEFLNSPFVLWIVQPDQYLSTIAMYMNASLKDIQLLNDLPNTEYITTGDVIMIPISPLILDDDKELLAHTAVADLLEWGKPGYELSPYWAPEDFPSAKQKVDQIRYNYRYNCPYHKQAELSLIMPPLSEQVSDIFKVFTLLCKDVEAEAYDTSLTERRVLIWFQFSAIAGGQWRVSRWCVNELRERPVKEHQNESHPCFFFITMD